MGGENDQQDCQSTASNDKEQARLISAVKKKFESMRTSDPMEALSPNVRKRVEALKEIQKQYDSFEEKFFEERAALEAKYQKLYEPLYTKRFEIVNGAIEVDDVSNEATADEKSTEEKGVPNFWLTAMKSNEILAEEIQERDEDALKYLKDIKWCKTDDPKGFKLEFYFDTNPYFKNSVLTKLYHMIDDSEPILEKVIGIEIEWYHGKNLTQKVLKKKPKKGSKNTKIMTKIEKCESFFNFFSPPEVPEDEDDLDDDTADQLQNEMEEDYDIGSTIRDKIIPHAVSWFTGEAAQDDGFEDLGVEEEDDEEEDEDEEDEDEDDEDDEEEEERIAQKKSGSHKMKGQPGDQPAECKQQ